jgi:tetratricopeptide (TPR) repeat protein
MQEKYSEAETQYRASIASFEKALGPDHPDVATGRSNFAIVLFEQGRNAQALPLAEKAWTRHQRDDIRAEQRATTAFGLARVLWAVDGPDRDRPRARQLAQAARDAYDEADGYEDMVAKVDQWLAAHRLR